MASYLTPLLFCRTSVKAAIVLQPLLGVTNILQIAFNPYNVGNISLLSCYQIKRTYFYLPWKFYSTQKLRNPKLRGE